MLARKNILTYFEQQVKKHPNNTAVVSENTEITYAELNDKANQFSNLLISKQLGPEKFVLLKTSKKSVELICCILGILKTGNCYVIINPELPKAQQEKIFHDLQPGLVISDETIHQLVKNSSKLSNQTPALKKSHRAYMIFTSGTTDLPKGVVISHLNLTKTYESWNEVYQLSPCDIHLQMANSFFDVFTGDWVRALCSGGKLVLCNQETLLDRTRLIGLLQTQKITVAEFVPATLRMLSQHLHENGLRLPKSLRLLICGSDTWTIREYKDVKPLASDKTRIINSYGLSEATIDSSWFELTESDSLRDPNQVVPIGTPFPHAQILVLNSDGNLIEPKEVGEIYIGGFGVSEEGYLLQQKLNTQSFIQLPQHPNKRFYKTGDLASIEPDGTILFLGRNELQANINGLRIDIPSIESTIMSLPSVLHAVVIPTKKRNTTSIALFAYIQESPGAKLNHTKLLQHLRNSNLEPHCYPKTFYLLEGSPLTPNGKTLRDPEKLMITRKLQRITIKPQNELEKKIQMLWETLLDVDKDEIGRNTDFFDLGGDSIAYTEMLTILNDRFGVALFSKRLTTIAELACMVSNNRFEVPLDTHAQTSLASEGAPQIEEYHDKEERC